MGKLQLFQIDIDKPAYFSGEKIRGSVVLHARERFKIKSIVVRAQGKAFVHWYIVY
jgi:hypothetical protein